jgi:hypothetical protein
VTASPPAIAHAALPLERVVRHRASALPAAWLPRVRTLAADIGHGVAEAAGRGARVLLPDPLRDRAFAAALATSFGEAVEVSPPRVGGEGSALAMRPVMAWRAQVPLRCGGPLRGELHRRGVLPDVFDVRLHCVDVRGHALLAALLGLDAWIESRTAGEGTLAMALHAWVPDDSGPAAA